MHRHRIEQLIREMDAAEWIEIVQRFLPANLFAKIAKRFGLAFLQDRKRFDDAVAHGREKLRRFCACRAENICGEIPMVRALFDDRKIIGPAEQLPHLCELGRQQPPEEQPHAHVREVIAFSPDRAAARAVIPVDRMIERLLHEPRECHRPIAPDLVANEVDQHRVIRRHGFERLQFGF